MAKETPEPDSDEFFAYVKDQLAAILDSLSDLKSGQKRLEDKLNAIDEGVKRNERKIGDLEEAANSTSTDVSELQKLTSNLNKWTKQLQDYDNELWVRVMNLERYSHEFNLRFHNVPEERSEECIPKLKSLIKNDLNLDVVKENAHRTGKARGNQPRQIIAKFLYRPDIRRIMMRRRDLKDGVFVTADLIREDREKKAEYRDRMKAAYNEGKKPRFYRGNLYIDGRLVT